MSDCKAIMSSERECIGCFIACGADEIAFAAKCCDHPICRYCAPNFIGNAKTPGKGEQCPNNGCTGNFDCSDICAYMRKTEGFPASVAMDYTAKALASRPAQIVVPSGSKEKDEETELKNQITDIYDAGQFRQCPNCKVSIQRLDQCMHMTCPCGTHFCNFCGREQGMGVGKCPAGGDEGCDYHVFGGCFLEDQKGYRMDPDAAIQLFHNQLSLFYLQLYFYTIYDTWSVMKTADWRAELLKIEEILKTLDLGGRYYTFTEVMRAKAPLFGKWKEKGFIVQGIGRLKLPIIGKSNLLVRGRKLLQNYINIWSVPNRVSRRERVRKDIPKIQRNWRKIRAWRKILLWQKLLEEWTKAAVIIQKNWRMVNHRRNWDTLIVLLRDRKMRHSEMRSKWNKLWMKISDPHVYDKLCRIHAKKKKCKTPGCKHCVNQWLVGEHKGMCHRKCNARVYGVQLPKLPTCPICYMLPCGPRGDGKGHHDTCSEECLRRISGQFVMVSGFPNLLGLGNIYDFKHMDAYIELLKISPNHSYIHFICDERGSVPIFEGTLIIQFNESDEPSENERDALEFVKEAKGFLNYVFNAELSGMTQSSPWEMVPVLRECIEIDVDYIGTSITNSSAMARMLSGYKHDGHNYICK